MNALVQNPPAGSTAAAVSSAGEPAQYLTFMLAQEQFAIGILGIKEIIEYQGLTEVPMMPPCVRGVINLRGAVVPVLDVQARFGRPSSRTTKRSCVVIVEVQGAGERHVVGLLVDAVNEVLDIAPTDIEPPPSFGARVRSEFIQGVGKVRGKFVLLLDADRALSLDEIGGLGAALPDARNEAAIA
jgi:purine-binding chemotaxis protein CheW